MKPFLAWMGGKQSLTRFILPYFPVDYKKYIEVFGGGASLLFAKKVDDFEVYNDLNFDLVNLFQVVRDRPLEFLEKLGCFPLNSRQEFYQLLRILKGKLKLSDYAKEEMEAAQRYFTDEELAVLCDLYESKSKDRDVERAVIYYKVIRYSYGNQGRSFACKPINLATVEETIHSCSSRIKNVIIENKDFEGLIRQYDSPDTFFYCDPPYYNAESRYQIRFKDHLRLYEILKSCQGKWLLSYNDCPEIKEYYQDYNKIEIQRANSLIYRYEKKPVYGELIIANYEFKKNGCPLMEQAHLF